uniref:Uncharacterized protein n=1 Tax=Oryza sativa subsp. japonica TaxID=39947 RepID=Q69XP9_ORYSJ|nr:hypothetical protein [Oryza sativa Japonica Group]
MVTGDIEDGRRRPAAAAAGSYRKPESSPDRDRSRLEGGLVHCAYRCVHVHWMSRVLSFADVDCMTSQFESTRV